MFASPPGLHSGERIRVISFVRYFFVLRPRLPSYVRRCRVHLPLWLAARKNQPQRASSKSGQQDGSADKRSPVCFAVRAPWTPLTGTLPAILYAAAEAAKQGHFAR
jgi:hypothetical protein